MLYITTQLCMYVPNYLCMGIKKEQMNELAGLRQHYIIIQMVTKTPKSNYVQVLLLIITYLSQLNTHDTLIMYRFLTKISRSFVYGIHGLQVLGRTTD